MLPTVELGAEAPERMRETLRWDPIDANAAESAEFVRQRGRMTTGWTGSFDNLEARLSHA